MGTARTVSQGTRSACLPPATQQCPAWAAQIFPKAKRVNSEQVPDNVLRFLQLILRCFVCLGLDQFAGPHGLHQNSFWRGRLRHKRCFPLLDCHALQLGAKGPKGDRKQIPDNILRCLQLSLRLILRCFVVPVFG
jgi:hypothetical protein